MAQPKKVEDIQLEQYAELGLRAPPKEWARALVEHRPNFMTYKHQLLMRETVPIDIDPNQPEKALEAQEEYRRRQRRALVPSFTEDEYNLLHKAFNEQVKLAEENGFYPLDSHQAPFEAVFGRIWVELLISIDPRKQNKEAGFETVKRSVKLVDGLVVVEKDTDEKTAQYVRERLKAINTALAVDLTINPDPKAAPLRTVKDLTNEEVFRFAAHFARNTISGADPKTAPAERWKIYGLLDSGNKKDFLDILGIDPAQTVRNSVTKENLFEHILQNLDKRYTELVDYLDPDNNPDGAEILGEIATLQQFRNFSFFKNVQRLDYLHVNQRNKKDVFAAENYTNAKTAVERDHAEYKGVIKETEASINKNGGFKIAPDKNPYLKKLGEDIQAALMPFGMDGTATPAVTAKFLEGLAKYPNAAATDNEFANRFIIQWLLASKQVDWINHFLTDSKYRVHLDDLKQCGMPDPVTSQQLLEFILQKGLDRRISGVPGPNVREILENISEARHLCNNLESFYKPAAAASATADDNITAVNALKSRCRLGQQYQSIDVADPKQIRQFTKEEAFKQLSKDIETDHTRQMESKKNRLAYIRQNRDFLIAMYRTRIARLDIPDASPEQKEQLQKQRKLYQTYIDSLRAEAEDLYRQELFGEEPVYRNADYRLLDTDILNWIFKLLGGGMPSQRSAAHTAPDGTQKTVQTYLTFQDDVDGISLLCEHTRVHTFDNEGNPKTIDRITGFADPNFYLHTNDEDQIAGSLLCFRNNITHAAFSGLDANGNPILSVSPHMYVGAKVVDEGREYGYYQYYLAPTNSYGNWSRPARIVTGLLMMSYGIPLTGALLLLRACFFGIIELGNAFNISDRPDWAQFFTTAFLTTNPATAGAQLLFTTAKGDIERGITDAATVNWANEQLNRCQLGPVVDKKLVSDYENELSRDAPEAKARVYDGTWKKLQARLEKTIDELRDNYMSANGGQPDKQQLLHEALVKMQVIRSEDVEKLRLQYTETKARQKGPEPQEFAVPGTHQTPRH